MGAFLAKSCAFMVTTIVAALGLSPQVQAGWKPLKDASIAYKTEIAVDLNADGTYTETTKATLIVLKARAVDRAGTFRFPYNEAMDRLLWVKGFIENQGQRTMLKEHQIIDKSERSEDGDVGSDRMVTLVYPGVQVGSVLTSMSAIETFVPPLTGNFATNFSFGDGYRESAGASLVIRSAKPLKVVVTGDPGYLKTAVRRKGTSYEVTATLLKDAYFSVIGEGSDKAFADSHVPRVWVSTAMGWDQIGDAIGARFEKEIVKPLPAPFEQIRADVKRQMGALSAGQVSDLVTSRLNDSMRYHSDTRGANSGYTARPMAAVARDLYGDCKDFSVVFAAIMRRLGYRAEVAAIYRDPGQWLEPALPTLSEFDHAIVRVEDRSRHVVWVDPTATVGRARFMDPDIAGRPVFVLGPKGSRLERTPILSARAQLPSQTLTTLSVRTVRLV